MHPRKTRSVSKSKGRFKRRRLHVPNCDHETPQGTTIQSVNSPVSTLKPVAYLLCSLDLASLRIGSPNPDAELDKILLEITDLVSEKFNDPSTVGDFMVDLRACAEGPAAATREVVTALLGQQNLTKENFMSLRDAIVARLLSYQINYNDHAPQ